MPGEDAERLQATFTELEAQVLDALVAGDGHALSRLLGADFVITTAGWLSGPVDRDTWLAELGRQHRLAAYRLHHVHVRHPADGVAIVLVESTQRGERGDETWAMDFRYTDVWVQRAGRWELVARHAGGHPAAS